MGREIEGLVARPGLGSRRREEKVLSRFYEWILKSDLRRGVPSGGTGKGVERERTNRERKR